MFTKKERMKILISFFSLGLLSFTTLRSATNKPSEPKLHIAVLPSDSLSLKNLRISSDLKKADLHKESKVAVKKSSGKSMNGIASFYSANLEGTKTATGEIFSHSKANVASNFFKLNTWVRVTNIKTGKSIVARVNDRMHPRMAAKGRVVDLTNKHAKTLGIYNSGLGKVKIEEVEPGTKE